MAKYEDYKIKGAIKKNKKYMIIALILWLFTVIVFVAPITLSGVQAKSVSGFSIDKFVTQFVQNITHPFSTIGGIFSTPGALKVFIGLTLATLVIYVILFWKGFKKDMPKHEYTNMEYGSSDWSKKGEQYRVLNNKEGIILAEDNYLPVDKRGNVNVLVVGRIWYR